MALVNFTVRELLTQPCPLGTGSVDCGDLGQGWGEGRGDVQSLRK